MSRLGVIGYGRRIRHMLQGIGRFNAGTEVVAVVDLAAEQLGREFPQELAGVTFCDDAAVMPDEANLDGVLGTGTR